MNMDRIFLSTLVLTALAVGSAAAEVRLSSVKWHLLPAQKSALRKAEPVERLVRAPAQLVGEPLGAVVTITNSGARPAVGVLLRYTIAARLSPIGQGDQGGIWEVPFWLEDVRIPQVGAGKEVSFTIRNLHLEAHLKKLRSEGFWPTALRVQVMAEPKTGEDLSQKILEAELPVVWETRTP